MRIMVTGAAGYIGSHTVHHLLRAGHTVVGVDNLLRGHAEPMKRLVERFGDNLTFTVGDVGDREAMTRLIGDHGIDTVMHFAALTYVGESVNEPLRYWRNNTASALSLIEAADSQSVQRFVFSSTAATYGEPGPENVPIVEDCPLAPINPYGQSKLAVERILSDWCRARRTAGHSVAVAALRYFNVAGCDRSELLGEDHDPETHLIPVVLQAALGKRDAITIFGTDYPTPDGTCIRDYIHVEDLAAAHEAVMLSLKPGEDRRYNLGIGKGYSVREVIDAARRVTGRDIPVREGQRRPGDPAVLFADPAKIQRELGWQAQITDLDAIVQSAWAWFNANPAGYPKHHD